VLFCRLRLLRQTSQQSLFAALSSSVIRHKVRILGLLVSRAIQRSATQSRSTFARSALCLPLPSRIPDTHSSPYQKLSNGSEKDVNHSVAFDGGSLVSSQFTSGACWGLAKLTVWFERRGSRPRNGSNQSFKLTRLGYDCHGARTHDGDYLTKPPISITPANANILVTAFVFQLRLLSALQLCFEDDGFLNAANTHDSVATRHPSR